MEDVTLFTCYRANVNNQQPLVLICQNLWNRNHLFYKHLIWKYCIRCQVYRDKMSLKSERYWMWDSCFWLKHLSRTKNIFYCGKNRMSHSPVFQMKKKSMGQNWILKDSTEHNSGSEGSKPAFVSHYIRVFQNLSFLLWRWGYQQEAGLSQRLKLVL